MSWWDEDEMDRDIETTQACVRKLMDDGFVVWDLDDKEDFNEFVTTIRDLIDKAAKGEYEVEPELLRHLIIVLYMRREQIEKLFRELMGFDTSQPKKLKKKAKRRKRKTRKKSSKLALL